MLSEADVADHNRLASTGAPLKEPLPPKQAVPPDHLFLPTLRHGTMGFEALGVLIQYLVCDVCLLYQSLITNDYVMVKLLTQ